MCPPSGSPPATYDYSASLPGTQGPVSPLVANAQTRSLRTHQLAIPIQVPLADLQAILPAGFTANPLATDPASAGVSLTLVYQQRLEIGGTGVFGPASSFFIGTGALNTALGRQESLLLAVFSPNIEMAGAFNGVFGAGSMLPGEVDVEIKETNGIVSIDGSVRHAATNLQLRVSATCPDPIDVRITNDPAPVPFRFMNGLTPNSAFRLASQVDSRQVASTVATAKVVPAHGPLRLPAGNVSISSLGPMVTFARSLEIFTKLE